MPFAGSKLALEEQPTAFLHVWFDDARYETVPENYDLVPLSFLACLARGSLVAKEKVATLAPLLVDRMSGSRPTLPKSVTRFMVVSLPLE